jgi:hypothetical protein
VYVPFSFLKSFYETAGDWAPGKEGREFDISLSYSKVRMDKFVSATVFLALSTISENFFDGQVVIVVDPKLTVMDLTPAPTVLQIRIRDPVLAYLLDLESGSGINFFTNKTTGTVAAETIRSNIR